VDRQEQVERAYQKGAALNIGNATYLRWVEQLFEWEYREDVGPGDLTTEAVLTDGKQGRAIVKANEPGIIAGAEEVSWFFRQHGLKVMPHMEDAQKILPGHSILEVSGDQRVLLAAERIGLNILQRMSGIATETRYLVDLIRACKTRVAATRKTPLRHLDKKAVFVGGGVTHRLGLWDSILIKDNHLQALKKDGVENHIEKAITRASGSIDQVGFIEIESTNQEDALRAARTFNQLQLKKPCIIMLDNVGPPEIHEFIQRLRTEKLYDHVLLEASGNITRGNITEYAQTGIDVVSLGYLTHSAKILDMSLELVM
jgi:nicotinate-nucleotide pyrophosphorylase (carboxylating)